MFAHMRRVIDEDDLRKLGRAVEAFSQDPRAVTVGLLHRPTGQRAPTDSLVKRADVASRDASRANM